MNDFYNEFESVFIDNDKPEIVPGVDCGQKCPQPPPITPPPKEYSRKPEVINRPYSDKPTPGPFRPDYYVDGFGEAQPNPVPNTYFVPGHKCPPPHKPCQPPPPKDRCIHPMHWEEDHKYVTKHELNHILMSIANADIFKDLSENGTTVSVGGIRKGTKFRKLTLAQLVSLMLYPGDAVDDEEFACETTDGRTVLNSTVKYPIGDLKEGDSLKGMTISQILESMLCGKNKWGPYRWISDSFVVDPMTTTIDVEEVFPYLVSDYRKDRVFEMHVVGNDSVTKDNYVYNETIAQLDNKTQKTNVTTEGVPSDIKWSYNPESKKITLHTDTEITSGITIIMIRR